MKIPVLFLSHGAPSLILEAGETGAVWRHLGETLPRPSAILVITAHWETRISRQFCGAASDLTLSQHLNHVMTFGMLAMDAWLFESVSRGAKISLPTAIMLALTGWT